ncbi:MAG: hypothetical protein COB65_07615 [Thalassobium sp.]|nr:MAG: hypothetical protein COB65_07615 [Thalassobium sp.]
MRIALFLPLAVLAACGPQPPIDPLRAAEICEDRARAAQGPTGSVTVGVNSNTGPNTDVEIGLSSDFLAGRDPLEVYRSCVVQKTGAEPVRPPNLR